MIKSPSRLGLSYRQNNYIKDIYNALPEAILDYNQKSKYNKR